MADDVDRRNIGASGQHGSDLIHAVLPGVEDDDLTGAAGQVRRNALNTRIDKGNFDALGRRHIADHGGRGSVLHSFGGSHSHNRRHISRVITVVVHYVRAGCRHRPIKNNARLKR